MYPNKSITFSKETKLIYEDCGMASHGQPGSALFWSVVIQLFFLSVFEGAVAETVLFGESLALLKLSHLLIESLLGIFEAFLIICVLPFKRIKLCVQLEI